MRLFGICGRGSRQGLGEGGWHWSWAWRVVCGRLGARRAFCWLGMR